MIATTLGTFAVVETTLPGGAAEAVGVVLHDPESKRLEAKFRRDWEEFATEDEIEVLEMLPAYLADLTRDLGPEEALRHLDGWSNTVRISDSETILIADFDRTLGRLYGQHVRPVVLPFRTHLPVYTCRAAAGHWGERGEVDSSPEEWIEAPEGMRLADNQFVAQVVGRSMEPLIPDGSLCVFRGGVGGSREGKRLLIEDRRASEQGERYTVKRYRSVKERAEDGSWRHARILLEPLNPEFEAWNLDPEDPDYAVIGEFVCVIESPVHPMK